MSGSANGFRHCAAPAVPAHAVASAPMSTAWMPKRLANQVGTSLRRTTARTRRAVQVDLDRDVFRSDRDVTNHVARREFERPVLGSPDHLGPIEIEEGAGPRERRRVRRTLSLGARREKRGPRSIPSAMRDSSATRLITTITVTAPRSSDAPGRRVRARRPRKAPRHFSCRRMDRSFFSRRLNDRRFRRSSRPAAAVATPPSPIGSDHPSGWGEACRKAPRSSG